MSAQTALNPRFFKPTVLQKTARQSLHLFHNSLFSKTIAMPRKLAQEAQRIHARSAQLAGRLDEAASNDQAIMGVGLVLFWPALFALGGTKEQEADFARLKGEYDAVQQTMIAKKCATVRSTAAAPASAASAAQTTPSDLTKPGLS